MCIVEPFPEDGGSTSSGTSRVVVSDGAEMPVLVARPPQPADGQPAALLLTDIGGLTQSYARIARRLTQHGVVVYVPDLFFRAGPLVEPTAEAVEGRRQAVEGDQLLSDLRILRHRIGQSSAGSVTTVGFCFGGTVALQLAATDVIPTVVHSGFPAGDGTAGEGPTPLDLVDRIRGPLLGFWGGLDDRIDMEDVRRFERELTHHGVAHDFRVYPFTEHAFHTSLADRGQASMAAELSWQALVAFIHNQRVAP